MRVTFWVWRQVDGDGRVPPFPFPSLYVSHGVPVRDVVRTSESLNGTPYRPNRKKRPRWSSRDLSLFLRQDDPRPQTPLYSSLTFSILSVDPFFGDQEFPGFLLSIIFNTCRYEKYSTKVFMIIRRFYA